MRTGLAESSWWVDSREDSMHTLLVLATASWSINACSTAAGSKRPPRFSSMSEFSSPSVQYLHLIFASSPTLTERVMMHSDINDMTNSVAGTENDIRNSRHVFPKSKRASTISASFCKWKERRAQKNGEHRIRAFVRWNKSACGRWLFELHQQWENKIAPSYLIVIAQESRLGCIVVAVPAMRLNEINTFAAQSVHASFQIDVQTTAIVNG